MNKLRNIKNEVYDGKVTLKIKGQFQRVYEYPTTRELYSLVDFVAGQIAQGYEVEHFEIQRSLNIL